MNKPNTGFSGTASEAQNSEHHKSSGDVQPSKPRRTCRVRLQAVLGFFFLIWTWWFGVNPVMAVTVNPQNVYRASKYSSFVGFNLLSDKTSYSIGRIRHDKQIIFSKGFHHFKLGTQYQIFEWLRCKLGFFCINENRYSIIGIVFGSKTFQMNNRNILDNVEHNKLNNSEFTSIFRKCWFIKSARKFRNGFKRFNTCAYNFVYCNFHVDFILAGRFSDFIQIEIARFVLINTGCSKEKVSAFYNFTSRIKNCFSRNRVFSFNPAIGASVNIAVVASQKNAGLSKSDSTEKNKAYPKYIRWSNNLALINDSLDISYDVVRSHEMDVSDDAKHWYHLFCVDLKSVCVRQVKKYGVNHNSDFLKRVYLSETITDSLYHYTDYDDKGNVIYDLEKVDVDISLDEKAWFHLFGATCKRKLFSFWITRRTF